MCIVIIDLSGVCFYSSRCEFWMASLHFHCLKCDLGLHLTMFLNIWSCFLRLLGMRFQFLNYYLADSIEIRKTRSYSNLSFSGLAQLARVHFLTNLLPQASTPALAYLLSSSLSNYVSFRKMIAFACTGISIFSTCNTLLLWIALLIKMNEKIILFKFILKIKIK